MNSQLVNQFAAGAQVSISFPQSGAAFQFPDPNGGLISSFTSYGPTNDMFFKPAVAAPGGNSVSFQPIFGQLVAGLRRSSPPTPSL